MAEKILGKDHFSPKTRVRYLEEQRDIMIDRLQSIDSSKILHPKWKHTFRYGKRKVSLFQDSPPMIKCQIIDQGMLSSLLETLAHIFSGLFKNTHLSAFQALGNLAYKNALYFASSGEQTIEVKDVKNIKDLLSDPALSKFLREHKHTPQETLLTVLAHKIQSITSLDAQARNDSASTFTGALLEQSAESSPNGSLAKTAKKVSKNSNLLINNVKKSTLSFLSKPRKIIIIKLFAGGLFLASLITIASLFQTQQSYLPPTRPMSPEKNSIDRPLPLNRHNSSEAIDELKIIEPFRYQNFENSVIDYFLSSYNETGVIHKSSKTFLFPEDAEYHEFRKFSSIFPKELTNHNSNIPCLIDSSMNIPKPEMLIPNATPILEMAPVFDSPKITIKIIEKQMEEENQALEKLEKFKIEIQSLRQRQNRILIEYAQTIKENLPEKEKVAFLEEYQQALMNLKSYCDEVEIPSRHSQQFIKQRVGELREFEDELKNLKKWSTGALKIVAEDLKWMDMSLIQYVWEKIHWISGGTIAVFIGCFKSEIRTLFSKHAQKKIAPYITPRLDRMSSHLEKKLPKIKQKLPKVLHPIFFIFSELIQRWQLSFQLASSSPSLYPLTPHGSRAGTPRTPYTNPYSPLAPQNPTPRLLLRLDSPPSLGILPSSPTTSPMTLNEPFQPLSLSSSSSNFAAPAGGVPPSPSDSPHYTAPAPVLVPPIDRLGALMRKVSGDQAREVVVTAQHEVWRARKRVAIPIAFQQKPSTSSPEQK